MNKNIEAMHWARANAEAAKIFGKTSIRSRLEPQADRQDFDGDRLLFAAFHLGIRAASLYPGMEGAEVIAAVAARDTTTIFPASEVEGADPSIINMLVRDERLIADRISRFLSGRTKSTPHRGPR